VHKDPLWMLFVFITRLRKLTQRAGGSHPSEIRSESGREKREGKAVS